MQIERNAIDTKYSAWEEKLQSFQDLAKSKVNDMAGCLQDKVEERLSSLHGDLHEQIEETHQRIDAQADKMSEFDELSQASQARAAQLGTVISSCLASIRSITARLDQLDAMREEVRVLAGVGDALMSAVRPRDIAA